MQIFLSGLMGSGKSTVGKALSELTGLPLVDLDAHIESRANATIPEIFAKEGEPAFRTLEREALNALVEEGTPRVIALGGGAVTQQDLRRMLIAKGLLVTLDAPTAVLAARVGRGEGRPLLSSADVVGKLDQLREQRAAAYAECHVRVDTSRLSAREAAERIERVARESSVLVPLGERTYRVVVGSGVRAQLTAEIDGLGDVSSVIVVTDTSVLPLWGKPLADAVAATGKRVTTLVLPPGESAKTLASVETLWHGALDAGADRRTLLIGVGGGVIGDLTGFAAATLLRGVRVGHVPTTLLAMVDSSVGGKTGFDTRHGKNLVGAFHQPSFVLADVDTLSSLPLEERRAGLAEVVKSAWIEGEAAVAGLERAQEALCAGEPVATAEAIRMSVRMKARIVTEDERDSGKRAWLNLGHTLGHAIEASLGFGGMRHGEAVALGTVAAFRVAERMGRGDARVTSRVTALLASLGLPTKVEPYLTDHVFSFLASDKKRAGATLQYVLPGRPGDIGLVKLTVPELIGLLR
jgi:shikimate kinase / 3-dehydroquinate synthase